MMAEIRENGCFRVLTFRNKALPLQRCPVSLGLFASLCHFKPSSGFPYNQVSFRGFGFLGIVDGGKQFICFAAALLCWQPAWHTVWRAS